MKKKGFYLFLSLITNYEVFFLVYMVMLLKCTKECIFKSFQCLFILSYTWGSVMYSTTLGELNENGFCICSVSILPVGGDFWEGLGGVALLEKVCHA